MKEPVGLTEFGEVVLDTILAGHDSAGAYLGSSVTVKEVVELANLYRLDAYEEEEGKVYISWHLEDMATAFAAKLMELEYIGLETVLMRVRLNLSKNNIIWYERCAPKEGEFGGVLFGLEKLHPMEQFSAIYKIKRGGGEVSVATSSPYIAETVLRLFSSVKVFKYSEGRLESSSAEEMFRSFCKPFEVFECFDGAALKGEDEVEVLESGYLEWQLT